MKRRRKASLPAGVVTGLLAEGAVVLVFGAVLSWMVTRGWLEYGQMEKGSGGALLIAGFAGGMLWKSGKKAPLLWGAGAGAALSLLCLICGVLLLEKGFAFRAESLLPILGGATAGVVGALKR